MCWWTLVCFHTLAVINMLQIWLPLLGYLLNCYEPEISLKCVCKHTSFSLSIHLLTNRHLDISISWLLWIMLQFSWKYNYVFEIILFPWIYAQKWACWIIFFFFFFFENSPYYFPHWLYQFSFLSIVYNGSLFSTFCWYVIFDWSIKVVKMQIAMLYSRLTKLSFFSKFCMWVLFSLKLQIQYVKLLVFYWTGIWWSGVDDERVKE